MTALRFTEDGKYALVLVNDSIAIATVRDGEFYGPRWECSPAHLDAYAGVYAKRFPVSA